MTMIPTAPVAARNSRRHLSGTKLSSFPWQPPAILPELGRRAVNGERLRFLFLHGVYRFDFPPESAVRVAVQGQSLWQVHSSDACAVEAASRRSLAIGSFLFSSRSKPPSSASKSGGRAVQHGVRPRPESLLAVHILPRAPGRGHERGAVGQLRVLPGIPPSIPPKTQIPS
jgi:hypothetical protein